MTILSRLESEKFFNKFFLARRSKRILELDVIRGIAALGVVFFHYFHHYFIIKGIDNGIFSIFWYGSYGVHVFFILSGFVIGWTTSSSNDVKKFLWNRFSRLYPAYWASVLITFSFLYIVGFENYKFGVSDLFINMTMLQKYFGVSNIDGSYWTLAVELAFYFVIVVLIIFRSLNYVLPVLLAITFFSMMNVIYLENDTISNILVGGYAQYFLLGCLLSRYQIDGFKLSHALYFISSIVFVYMDEGLRITIGVFLVFLVFIFFIKFEVPVLHNRFLLYLGSVSYSLYLLHQYIGYALIDYFYKVFGYFSIAIFLTTLMIFLLTNMVHRFVEVPSLKIMRRM